MKQFTKFAHLGRPRKDAHVPYNVGEKHIYPDDNLGYHSVNSTPRKEAKSCNVKRRLSAEVVEDIKSSKKDLIKLNHIMHKLDNLRDKSPLKRIRNRISDPTTNLICNIRPKYASIPTESRQRHQPFYKENLDLEIPDANLDVNDIFEEIKTCFPLPELSTTSKQKRSLSI